MLELAVLVAWSSGLAAAQVSSCPGDWWYCLQREPADSSLVTAEDTSNRSMSWTWDVAGGRWAVRYTHSFVSGEYNVDACYTPTGSVAACIGYSPTAGWRGSQSPISARPWDLAYNGDRFGFRPKQPSDRYTFHIYSRNVHYDPWVTAPPIVQGGCVEAPNQRTEGRGWWLERKAALKCPVTASREELVSPADWSWESDAGRWTVRYSWDKDETRCNVSLLTSGKTTQLMSWTYYPRQLLISYTGSPTRVYREAGWTLMVIDGEAWGFQPKEDGTWLFPIYSRNVIIRPFERAQGTFNLQL